LERSSRLWIDEPGAQKTSNYTVTCEFDLGATPSGISGACFFGFPLRADRCDEQRNAEVKVAAKKMHTVRTFILPIVRLTRAIS
jgi:hypothetical protein